MSFSDNQLTGYIPAELCYQALFVWVENNQFCPPYPDCLSQEEIDPQDTSACEELSNIEIYPFEYSLGKPYPNPFNPTATISFSIPAYEFISIKVYDLNGKLIANLIEKNLGPGEHTVIWDAKNSSSGQYLVKMDAMNFSKTELVTLVK